MSSKLRAVLPMLLDLIIPVAGYYLLIALGLSDFWALTIAGVATAVHAAITTFRRGRLDSLGALVVLEIALSVVLFFITRDPRIVLLKPSFYTGLAGVYLLYTCLVHRPFTMDSTTPFATRGDPERERQYEIAATSNGAFRREHQRITAVWAVLWLAEAALRIPVVLHTDISTGVLVGHVPGLVALALGIVFTRLRVPALRRHAATEPGRVG